MHRFASAGSAAHRAYICRPCLRQLALLERPASSFGLTGQKQRRHVSSSRVLKEASIPLEESKSSDPVSASGTIETGNGKQPNSTAENASSETSTRTYTGEREPEAQINKASPKRKPAKKKLRDQEPSLNEQEAAPFDNKAPDGTKEEQASSENDILKLKSTAKSKRSKKIAGQISVSAEDDKTTGRKSRKKLQNIWAYKYIKENHEYLQTKVIALRKARIRRGKSRLQIPDYMVKRHRSLERLARRVEKKIKLNIDHFNPAGSEHHDSLKGLSESVTEMLNDLVGMDSRLSRFTSQAPLDTAMQKLRCGQALKQLIAARKNFMKGKADSDSGKTSDTSESPAIAVLIDGATRHPKCDAMPPEIKEDLYAKLQELIPEVGRADLPRLLIMFSNYLQAIETSPSESVDANEPDPIEGVSIGEHYGKRTLKEAMKSPGLRKTKRDTKAVAEEAVDEQQDEDTEQPGMNTDDLAVPITNTRLDSADLKLEPIHIEQAPVRGLSYGLDRVLFNQGVYMLQDPRSKVYNFDPYLQNIMQVEDFNFDLIPAFVTSSKDETLQKIAREAQKKYTGSSSSMTGMLSHFHYLLSKFRPINQSQFSRYFQTLDHHSDFTTITKCPAAVFLRWKEKEGLYAIDGDKEHDEMNALSLLGNSLERLLTLPKDKYERFRKGSKERMSEEEANAPETYHYTGFEDVLMRSQLDAHDPRLPGSGMFDLKTRAVLPIRMDVAEYKSNRDYELRLSNGNFESFEREYMDMLRATMIKYMLQVRIGRMDGIFVAYHNTVRLFGFQYVPIEEIDLALHGQYDRSLGDEEFKLSVSLMNKVFNTATERFPKSSLRVHFHTQGGVTRNKMLIFVEPFTEEAADEIQTKNQERNALITKEILAGIPPNYDGDGKRIVRTDLDDVADNMNFDKDVPEQQNVNDESRADDSASQVKLEEVDHLEGAMTATDGGMAQEKFSSGAEDLKSDGETPTGSVGDSASNDESKVEDKKPLLVLQLTVSNFVNGASVVRPGFTEEKDSTKRLEEVSETFSTSKGDKWTIDYKLSEIKPAKVAWQLYRQTLAKRASLISFDRGNSSLEFVRSVLKKYVQRGREYRQRKNAEEGPNPPKVQLGDVRPQGNSRD